MLAETAVWRCLKETSGTPPACASCTLTAVGHDSILAFGGHGKKDLNVLHCLSPSTLAWEPIIAAGVSIRAAPSLNPKKYMFKFCPHLTTQCAHTSQLSLLGLCLAVFAQLQPDMVVLRGGVC